MATTTAAAKKKYTWGTGRRKSAVARVRIADGKGLFLVNGRPVDNFFTEERERDDVRKPLAVVDMAGKLDVFVNVKGGGFTGQAGAIKQGLARALLTMYLPLEGTAPPPPPAAPAVVGEAPAPPVKVPATPVKRIKDSGLLTRDARMKERKKYGRRGARRSFQFSKR